MEDKILTLRIAEISETEPQFPSQGLPISVRQHEDTDLCQLELLRMRCKRPYCRDAETRDELTPSSIEHRELFLCTRLPQCTLPQGNGQVLGIDLNCSESRLSVRLRIKSGHAAVALDVGFAEGAWMDDYEYAP